MIEKASPKRNRHSLRFQGYDYSQVRMYFVTLSRQRGKCRFWEIVDGEMRLNDVRRGVADGWLKTIQIREEIERDEWVLTPNHFHGVLVIGDCRGYRPVSPVKIREPIVKYGVEARIS